MSSQKQELQHSLDLISERLEDLASLKKNFVRGIVRGLGTAIGATVVAGLAFAIANSVVDRVDETPIIESIIDQTNIERSLNERSDEQ